MTPFSPSARRALAAVLLLAAPIAATAQKDWQRRGSKPLPPTAQVVITVEKGFNKKPLPNASVIFRADREGQLVGNLETKTDPDGRASIDLLEVGTHVTVQVIANGFATYATDFDLTKDGKELTATLQRPRAQVSQYEDGTDRPATVQPGVQEHAKPTAPVPAPAASPTKPLKTTPPASTPSNATPNTTTGDPQ